MSHSVESHLVIDPSTYDREIRRFVPSYETMHDEILATLAEHLHGDAPRVIDLGAGTGALAARVAARFPTARLVLVDADRAMLAQAEVRLAPYRARVELIEGSFAAPLPACDAAVASLALHHLHTRDGKRDAYRHIRAALPPGGVWVNGDAAVPAARALADPVMARWAAHLQAHGDSEAEAYARFAQWATEDRYFGIDEELDLLREAGFAEVDVRWRVGSQAVLVARR